MPTAITHDIQVSVQTTYSESHSNSEESFYFFIYEISIQNNGPYQVKLLRRHWHIIDTNLVKTEVEGEGVIGKQPLLESGESFTYRSACNISSPIGKMFGTYVFERISDGSTFDVMIPEFQLAVPFVLN
jgi:ApaG protein